MSKNVIKFSDLTEKDIFSSDFISEPTSRQLVQINKDLYSQFKSALKKELKNYKPVKISKINKLPKSTIAQLTDIHIGKRAIFGNKVFYDVDIALKRLGVYFAKLEQHINESNPNKLVLALNGDMVEGEGLIFKTQAWHIDALLIDQLKKLSACMWHYLSKLSELVPVEVYCVPGNHGNTRGAEKTNWDNVLYWELQLASVVSKNKKISVIFPENEFVDFSVRGWNFHMRHKIVKHPNSPGGRSIVLGHAKNHNADVILTGHWHSTQIYDINKIWAIYGGFLGGTDDYSDTLSYNANPCQIVFDVTDTQPVVNIEIINVGNQ